MAHLKERCDHTMSFNKIAMFEPHISVNCAKTNATKLWSFHKSLIIICSECRVSMRFFSRKTARSSALIRHNHFCNFLVILAVWDSRVAKSLFFLCLKCAFIEK